MSTYRERREAKADRLREWADKRDTKATAGFKKANDIADMIPFGQPILVGHHSEGRARRDQERIRSGMTAGIEHSNKADEFRRRADGIEHAAENAVYSDDVDAIERLTERIAAREAERDRIKAYNATARKGEPDGSLLDNKQRENLLSIAKVASYQLGKGGAFPSYVLSNLGGTIRKDKERLDELNGGAPALFMVQYQRPGEDWTDYTERSTKAKAQFSERQAQNIYGWPTRIKELAS